MWPNFASLKANADKCKECERAQATNLAMTATLWTAKQDQPVRS